MKKGEEEGGRRMTLKWPVTICSAWRRTCVHHEWSNAQSMPRFVFPMHMSKGLHWVPITGQIPTFGSAQPATGSRSLKKRTAAQYAIKKVRVYFTTTSTIIRQFQAMLVQAATVVCVRQSSLKQRISISKLRLLQSENKFITFSSGFCDQSILFRDDDSRWLHRLGSSQEALEFKSGWEVLMGQSEVQNWLKSTATEVMRFSSIVAQGPSYRLLSCATPERWSFRVEQRSSFFFPLS